MKTAILKGIHLLLLLATIVVLPACQSGVESDREENKGEKIEQDEKEKKDSEGKQDKDEEDKEDKDEERKKNKSKKDND
jgi:hypothetical protein